jgi:aryl-alcohol dehydrogenase-like predicted oxidoreductase
MQTVTLGRTGLNVSVAALGAGGKSRLGQAQGASFDHSVGLVRSAIDRGVTLIDTAELYGTEEIVGAAIKGCRDGLVISTKVAPTRDFQSSEPISTEEFTRRVESCLKRLGTDRIDILHVHGPRPTQYAHVRDELLPAIHRLREQGKVRFSAVSEHFNSDPRHEMLIQAVREAHFDVVMVGYNFVNQTAASELLPLAAENGIGTLCMFAVRGPLARLATANALVEKLIATGEVDPAFVDRANPLGFLVGPGVAATAGEAAYRFCRHAPGIDVVITGTGSKEHLAENLAAIAGPPLPPAVIERLGKIFGRVVTETGEP